MRKLLIKADPLSKWSIQAQAPTVAWTAHRGGDRIDRRPSAQPPTAMAVRSLSMTLDQAVAKSRANFGLASAQA